MIKMPKDMNLADVAKGAHRPPVRHDNVNMIVTKGHVYVAQTMMDDPKWHYDRELLVRGYNHIAEAAELLALAMILVENYVPAWNDEGKQFRKRASLLLLKANGIGN